MIASVPGIIPGKLGLSVTVVALLHSWLGFTPAWGQSLEPTQFEFDTWWPRYCPARYVSAEHGKGSRFALTFPKTEILKWQKKVDGGAWTHLHHFCNGTLWLGRVTHRLPNDYKRKYFLDEAVSEFEYVLLAVPESNPMYPEFLAYTAEAYRLQGREADATEFLQRAIRLKPSYEEPYLTLAKIARDRGDVSEARSVLSNGLNATQGRSARLHYMIALVNIDLNDLDAAVRHAKQAYAQGSEFAGLKRKLKELNRWQE